MSAYYNEHDPFAAAWLRNLIDAGEIAPGVVDERDIQQITEDDVEGFTQVHLFAGIGGWPLALRLAGWPDGRPVWTGSCPCQPFSSAGKRKGAADERHLWPEMFRLIQKCRPERIYGEQVASSDAIGRNLAAGRKDVQRVLDEQTFVRVLREQGGPLEELLSAMQQGKEREPKDSDLFGATSLASRGNPRGGSEVSIREDGPPIQLGRSGHPASNRGGSLRVDRDRIRPNDSEGVEHSISGSNQTGRRLHDGERARDSIRDECDGAHMGAKQGHRIGGRDSDPADCPVERLIRAHCGPTQKPPTDWLAGVQHDLDAAGYSFGACVLAASSIGAPHIRQRLYWMAESEHEHHRRVCGDVENPPRPPRNTSRREGENGDAIACSGATKRLAIANGTQLQREPRAGEQPIDEQDDRIGRLEHAAGDGRDERRPESGGRGAAGGCEPSGLGDGQQQRLEGHAGDGDDRDEPGRIDAQEAGSTAATSATGFWSDHKFIPCSDGKSRRTQPGIFPLVDGIPSRLGPLLTALRPLGSRAIKTARGNRTGRLKGYGNAIVPELAAEFIFASEVA